MAKFFDNMSGRQKLVLIFGGGIFLVGSMVVFPGETQSLIGSAMDGLRTTLQFFRDIGGTP